MQPLCKQPQEPMYMKFLNNSFEGIVAALGSLMSSTCLPFSLAH